VRTDKNGTPYRGSFYFGLNFCAYCLGLVSNGRTVRRVRSPSFGDVKQTEIMIPEGRQAFHKNCWLHFRYPEDSAAKGDGG
jgi:hypothetical protein